jgi:hypothetical protein
LILALPAAVTALVLTWKFIVRVPAGTSSDGTAGCAIDGFVLDSATVMSFSAIECT